jgi:hypothetical protein
LKKPICGVDLVASLCATSESSQCNTPICVPFAKHHDKHVCSQFGGIAFKLDQVNQGSQHGNMSKQRKSAFEEYNGTGHHLEGSRVYQKTAGNVVV